MRKWRLVGSSNDAVHGSCFVVMDNGTGVQVSDGRVHVGAPYRTSNSMKDPVKFSFVVPSYLSAHGACRKWALTFIGTGTRPYGSVNASDNGLTLSLSGLAM